jgi:hypothetical protein
MISDIELDQAQSTPRAQILLLLPVPDSLDTGPSIMETSNPPPHAQKSMVKSLIAYSIICMLVIAVVVSLRFYIRLRVIRKFGHDDAALAATVVRTPPPTRYFDIGESTQRTRSTA